MSPSSVSLYSIIHAINSLPFSISVCFRLFDLMTESSLPGKLHKQIKMETCIHVL